MKKTKLGFSLIEVLTVLAILGLILPALFISIISVIREQAKLLAIQNLLENSTETVDAIKTYIEKNNSNYTSKVRAVGVANPTNLIELDVGEKITSNNGLYIEYNKSPVPTYTLTILTNENKISVYENLTENKLTDNNISIENFQISAEKLNGDNILIEYSFNSIYRTSSLTVPTMMFKGSTILKINQFKLE